MKEQVLRKFNLSETNFLGSGGESWVYKLDESRILRIYKGQRNRLWYLKKLKSFYAHLPIDMPFELPRIYHLGEVGDSLYSIENLIEGQELANVLPKLSSKEKQVALDNYLQAVEILRSVIFEDKLYGELLTEHPVTRKSWKEFLVTMVQNAASNNEADLGRDLRNFREVIEATIRLIDAIPEPPKALVHGDYFPKNLLVNDALEVTGIIDFSPMTMIGDPLMDVAGALLFLEVVETYDPSDSAELLKIIHERYGLEIDPTINLYRIYYSFYFSGAKQDDPKLYKWCINNLANFGSSTKT